MKHNKTQKTSTGRKTSTNLPAIPIFQGGFVNRGENYKTYSTARYNKGNLVDGSFCDEFSGRVAGSALSQPLTLKKSSRGWI